MAKTTTLKAAELVFGEIENCGIETESVVNSAKLFIDVGISCQTAEGLAELIFAVYYATKEKYGLTIATKPTNLQR